MAQSIQHDRYPKFVADQVLTEKSLNQMFGYLEEQQRLTRTTLIGIGIMCGMKVRVNDDGTSLTITHGVGVTSKGYLVPFPETTYTFYNDKFSAEQEFIYKPFVDANNKQKFPLYLLHNNGAAEIKKPINKAFLEDKAVVIFVELLKVDNKNCDPDSCDDKGCTVEVTHRPLLVDLKNINDLIFGGDKENPFLHEASCIEWPALKMPRYNVPSTYILNSEMVLKNFLDLLNKEFILNIEKVLKAAYNSLGYYIEDEFPNNPFSGLTNKFSFLFDGSLSIQQLLYVQYYYDFFSDLMLAYEELRQMCNECLAICCPNEKLFPRHLILGNAIPAANEYRHHWIQSPAFSCNCCSEGRIHFLLRKIAILIQKLDLPKNIFSNRKDGVSVKITPSRYGNLPLSDKAIPYYYDVVKNPYRLYDNWNYHKTKLNKGDTNLSYFASDYNNDPYVVDPLSYDIEPYNFLRIEGHLGKNWKHAISEVSKIKKEKRLPIEVVALNGDIFELIRSMMSNSNSLADIIQGNTNIAGELKCYFGDIEAQYDAHAAELRCTILKVMAYLYNLKIFGRKEDIQTTDSIPESDMVRKAFPNYRTFANTYGERFDAFYKLVKNQPYITPQALMFSSTFSDGVSTVGTQNNLLNPIYLMYYLEKIHEALADGLIELKINDLVQRIQDASLVATVFLQALDNIEEFDMPALLEESLDAVIRICKAQVFNVLYRNFLINYALFISNQSFAMYAFKNPGIQHKAGVTIGGTFILVYHDKREERFGNFTTGEVLVTNDNNDNLNATLNTNFTTETSNFTHGNFTSEASAIEAEKMFKATREKLNYSAARKNPILELRNNATVKGLGLNDLFGLVDHQRENDKLTDKELSELVSQFPDGTVIADFFVPNMCKSSCMPMNFIVMDDKEQEPGDITLEIKPRAFCEEDREKYEIRIEPKDGKLSIDEDQVDDNTFIPNKFPITDANAPFREIIITYEFNGNVKNIRVRVYRKPIVKIGIISIDDASHVVEFTNDTQFAEKFLWNFGNGNASEEKDPGKVEFGDLQTAIVTLKAFNGPCENESQPLTISFEEQPTQRSCSPINEIGDLFTKMNSLSNTEFQSNIEQYQMLKSIFIDKFDSIVILPQKDQFELLSADITVDVIQKILNILNGLIKSNPEMRRLAMLLYEILLRLTLFYACCQKDDVDKAKVKTEKLLNLIIRQIKSWLQGIDFKTTEKNIIKKMLKVVEVELNRTTNDTPEKALYINLLKELHNVLSQF